MPRGGARPGSGPKKGSKKPQTLQKEMAREQLRQRVYAEMAPLVEAQIKHAKGISYLVYRQKRGGKFTKVTAENASSLFKLAKKPGEDGGLVIEVWEKEPSVQAFTDLMNRAIDKPAETLTATVGGTLTVELESRIKAARDRLAQVKHGHGQHRA